MIINWRVSGHNVVGDSICCNDVSSSIQSELVPATFGWSFPAILHPTLVDFERRLPFFLLVLHGEYATMYSEAELSAERQVSLPAILHSSLYQFRSKTHGRTHFNNRPLRRCSHPIASQRVCPACCPARSKLSDSEKAIRFPSMRRRDRHVDRRPRTPLGRAFGRRDRNGGAENANRVLQLIDGQISVFKTTQRHAAAQRRYPS